MTAYTATLIVIFIPCLALFIHAIGRAIIYKGHRGRSIAIAVGAVMGALLLPLLTEDILFFKADARNMLAENGLKLNDHFKISAHQVSGFSERTELVTIEISDKDKAANIHTIRSSPYFTDSAHANNFPGLLGNRPTERIFCDNEQSDCYQRQSYEKLQAYRSTHDLIQIDKKRNEIFILRED